MSFDNTVGKKKITLLQDASYSNCVPVDQLIFKKGQTILDGQGLTQLFRITTPSKNALISINFEDGIKMEAIEIGGQDKIARENANKSPIGSIVASFLPYNQFMTVNGLSASWDKATSIWAPCDGRDVSGSHYGDYGSPVAPDLRGVFLRGANSMFPNNASAGTVNPNQLNPESKPVGTFQNDAIQQHVHPIGVGQSDKKAESQTKTRFADFIDSNRNPKLSSQGVNRARVSAHETRPKSYIVYYYIKIQ